MELHPAVRYLHIGCDEVFQMGECPRCRNTLRENLFLGHVARVAKYVRSKYSFRGQPVTPIIWHDMLQHLAPQSMEEYHLGDLVEPMVSEQAWHCGGRRTEHFPYSKVSPTHSTCAVCVN